MKKTLLLLAPLLLNLAGPGRADVTLPDIIADHMIIQADQPSHFWGKADPNEAVTVTMNGQSAKTAAGADGKWSLNLPAQKAGGPTTVDIAGKNKIQLSDVLVGEVWLASGQSNMDMRVYPTPPWTNGVTDYKKVIEEATNTNIHFFTVFIEASEKPEDEIHGAWEVCSPATAGNFSAVGYFFALKLQADLKVPVGIINSSVGATSITSWLDAEHVAQLPNAKRAIDATARHLADNAQKLDDYRLSLVDYHKKAREDRKTPGKLTNHPELYKGYVFQPSGCYNAMIAPIVGYPIRGFLWWQGESDSSWAAGYTEALKTLIETWRAKWNEPDAPFLVVQISGRGPLPPKKGEAPKPITDNWPKQRIAQAAVVDKVPHTAIAISCDLGDYEMVHFPNKRPVGERLELAALRLAYDQDKIDYFGPLVDKVAVKDDTLTVQFKSDGNLVSSSGTEVGGFEIAGADKAFHPAIGKLSGDTLTLTSKEVAAPIAVRYGWNEFPKMTLFDARGLPARPFIRDTTNPHAEADAVQAPAATPDSDN